MRGHGGVSKLDPRKGAAMDRAQWSSMALGVDPNVQTHQN